MLTVRIIPCLDVKEGRVVKGVSFQGLRDVGCPVELSKAYEAQGADELVYLDVSATTEVRKTHTETVKKMRAALSIPLTTGGGVKEVADAKRLLDAGADKVSANTAAVTKPNLVNELSNEFGRQCTVIAIDAAKKSSNSLSWEVVTHSGKNRTGMCAVDWAKDIEQRGAGEILLTSWDKDGTRSGYDLELLEAVSKNVSIPIIASGGANSPQHLLEGLTHGASAVLAASIFHDGDYTVLELKKYLKENNIEVRL